MSLSIVGLDGKPFDESTAGAIQLNFGKTKYVLQLSDDRLAIEHKDILTAFDDPEFTGNAPGKGAASAFTSALLFRRLEAKGVRTAHRGFVNANTTLEEGLEMFPFEIIGRSFNADGNSWEKRHPGKIEKGIRYPEVKYEVGLKYSVVAENGEVCNDPFLILDENFEPILNEQGLPRLIHQQKPGEIRYTKFTHPNQKTDVSDDTVRQAITEFKQYAPQIREMAVSVQESVVETYARIGRLDVDWKMEVGKNKKGELTLGDELELDAMRILSLRKIIIGGKEYEFEEDALGKDLYELLAGGPSSVTKIIEARHSGKQHYRDQVTTGKGKPFDDARRIHNNQAAARTTAEIYIPVALALSERFSNEVGYRLVHTA